MTEYFVFNPFMPKVSLMTHKEIDENQIVKRIFDSFSMFKYEYKVWNDSSKPVTIGVKHTETITNTFSNMILSNSLCVFQDTLGGNGLIHKSYGTLTVL